MSSPAPFIPRSGINNDTTFALDPATVSVEAKFFDGNGRVLTQKTYSL